MQPRKSQPSLRRQIVIATVMFTVSLSVAVSIFFFVLSSYYTKQTKLQSIEFNLTLVASTIKTSISNAESLLYWSSNTNSIRQYLTSANLTPEQLLLAYNAANTEYYANQSQQNIQRFFITDESERFLQYGMGITSSQPLTSYTIDTFSYIGNDSASKWEHITNDPLIPNHAAGLVAYFPITQGISQEKIGSAYLTLDLDVITEPLQGYISESGANLYWLMGDSTWIIEQDSLTEIDATFFSAHDIAGDYGLAHDTILQEITIDGVQHWQLLCPVGIDDLYIAQSIPTTNLQIQGKIYFIAMLGCVLFILLMSLTLMAWLNRTVSRPIVHLQERMHAVGAGDFSADPSIEWQSELGDIGRGINQLSANIDGLMTRRLEYQRQHQELEYRMLQNEINPHFIYNTLNSIRWMATIQHATGISEMVTSLSHLLKSISKSNEKLVSLQDELALLNDYFLIQQYRYGGDLNMDVSYIEDEKICRDCLIPRFTLQPIAENAIFHGLEPAGGVGSILLDIRTQEDAVCIRVVDNGVGMSAEQCAVALAPPSPEQADEKFRHVGLWNVHKRIQYSFGEAYGITLESKLGHGTCVIVRLPYHPQNTEDVQ